MCGIKWPPEREKEYECPIRDFQHRYRVCQRPSAFIPVHGSMINDLSSNSSWERSSLGQSQDDGGVHWHNDISGSRQVPGNSDSSPSE